MIWLMEKLKFFLEASNQVLRDKTFDIAKNPKYNRYQQALKFFDEKVFG